jgi:deoxyribodipyrimidine photolyase-related protein
MRTVVILGDQLHRHTSALSNATPDDTRIVMVISRRQLASKRWHRQRLHLVLSSMGKLARTLRTEGFEVDERVADTLGDGIDEHVAQYRPSVIEAMSPMSWRMVQTLTKHGVALTPNNQFLCDASTFAEWAAGRPNRLRMEDFYRWQRQRLDVLMEPDGEPCGGRWNYDADNREPPPKDGRSWPEPEHFADDDVDHRVATLIDELAPQAFGEPWDGLWPTTTAQAEQRLDRVISDVLPHFGPHEDAMMADEWHLAHTLLSSSLNIGLLHPRVVVERAEAAYRAGTIDLASAEGFIRQVIGWREYVWGLYWLWMPDYANLNSLEAHDEIPPAFIGGSTHMRCVATTIKDMDQRAYAHHIQRLMVLGNLALLAGIDPQAMTQWMWAGFIDAAEWVMVPNVVGMSLHADGGKMATKPYASGGAYINKMSNYCKGCRYDPKKRVGPTACPYTTLYWDFLARHQAQFASNHRMAQPMAGLRRLSDLPAVRERATDVRLMLQRGEL